MRKKYLTPLTESVYLAHENFLMSSTNGDLGDLGEISIITDSIVDADEMGLMLF